MLAVLALLSFGPAEPTPAHPVTLPTEFFENRFIVTPTLPGGRTLRFLTDSAGGLVLTQETAQELGLRVTDEKTALPPDLNLPAPPEIFVAPRKEIEALGPSLDGILGQQWFGGRAWTFDYPGKKLLWRAPNDLPKHKPEHEAKLFFQTNAQGVRQSNFARIEATIDGETLSFLVDTGATNVLTPEALQEVADGRPANRATSFLTRSVYDRWHAKHSDWRVVTGKTMTGQAMIQVPHVTVADYTVGPVWFTVQRDLAFHEYMAQWMDKPTEGALGGSAFKYFRLTVDWPNSVAVFERPKRS